MKRPKPPSDDVIIAAYHNESRRVIDIISDLRIGHVKLRQVLKDHNIATREATRAKAIQAAIAAYKDGEKALDIEKRTGIGHQRLYCALRVRGIKTNNLYVSRPRRKPKWCLWCGEDIDKNNRGKWCNIDCRRCYAADLKGEVPHDCTLCGKTMARSSIRKRCESCIAARQKRRGYKSKRREACAAEGCDNPIPWSRKVYCCSECRNAAHKPRFSPEELADIKRRVTLAKSFGPVARELGMDRVALIGLLFRKGFTLERATHEASHQIAHPEGGRFAGVQYLRGNLSGAHLAKEDHPGEGRQASGMPGSGDAHLRRAG